ncbi:hypothetical protein HK098_007114 [Nowakowskiella sp. JEL0407]|nr:hypothetical protein HK098_007114 [Nowakowskiella sp. JEL0407]
MDKSTKIPVTILTGFLGAGKTTLLNVLLKDLKSEPNLRVAVIENEFAAAFGIENELLDHNHAPHVLEEIYEFGFGCVCCSGSTELMRTLGKIEEKNSARPDERINWIILETTGLADPGPVIQVVAGDSYLSEYFYIDQVVTVVDSQHFKARVILSTSEDSLYKNESLAQVQNADLVIVNKSDLVSVSELDNIKEYLSTLSNSPTVITTTFSKIPLQTIRPKQSERSPPPFDPKIHDPNISAISLFIPISVPINLTKISDFIAILLKGGKIGDFEMKKGVVLRVKGVLAVENDPVKWTIQGVGGPGGRDDGEKVDLNIRKHEFGREWEMDEDRESRLTVIGYGVSDILDVLQNAIENYII